MNSRPNTFRPLLALVFLLVGIALLVCGGKSAYHTYSLLAHGVRTIGIIESSPQGKGGYMQVSFFDENRQHVMMPATGENDPLFQKGQQIGIIYDSENSKDAVVDTFMNLWIVALVCMGAGIACLVISISGFTRIDHQWA